MVLGSGNSCDIFSKKGNNIREGFHFENTLSVYLVMRENLKMSSQLQNFTQDQPCGLRHGLQNAKNFSNLESYLMSSDSEHLREESPNDAWRGHRACLQNICFSAPSIRHSTYLKCYL